MSSSVTKMALTDCFGAPQSVNFRLATGAALECNSRPEWGGRTVRPPPIRMRAATFKPMPGEAVTVEAGELARGNSNG